jgi:hypothetical protein
MTGHERSVVDTDVTEAEMRALDVDLESVWRGIRAEVWAPPTGRAERWTASALQSPALARALVTTPSLLVSWLIASVVVFALGAAVAGVTDQPVVPLLAPAVASVAVAFAYGAGADPAYEIARTMPVPARMILLVRVCAVFVTNALLGLAATLVSPALGGITLLWLLPMMAISLLGLAIAVVSHSAVVGGVLSLAVWSSFVVGGQLRESDFAWVARAATVEAMVPWYLAIAVASLAITLWTSSDSAQRREWAGWM